jgi:hypothetical protein
MFSAARLAAIVGSMWAATSGVETPDTSALRGPRAAESAQVEGATFVFGAGDALGVQIRAHDAALARRLGVGGVQHASVDTDR